MQAKIAMLNRNVAKFGEDSLVWMQKRPYNAVIWC